MSDNGSCRKAFEFPDTCSDLGLKRIRTKPCTPQTNGKAERFIQTALRDGTPPNPIRSPNTDALPCCRLAASLQPALTEWRLEIANADQPPRPLGG